MFGVSGGLSRRVAGNRLGGAAAGRRRLPFPPIEIGGPKVPASEENLQFFLQPVIDRCTRRRATTGSLAKPSGSFGRVIPGPVVSPGGRRFAYNTSTGAPRLVDDVFGFPH